MKKNQKLLFFMLFFLMFFTFCLSGQNFDKLVKEGDQAYNKKDFPTAVKSYDTAFQTIKHFKVKHLKFLYKYGQSEMQVADYHKAVNAFNTYLEIADLSFEITDRLQVEEWLKYCEPKLTVATDNVKLPGYENIVQVINLRDINTQFDEYTPYYYSKERILLYSSGKETSKGRKKLEEKGADIYFSKFDSGKFTLPQPYGNQFNTTLQDLDPFISPDDNYFYYTRVKYSDILTKKRYPGKFMVSAKKESVWASPKELPAKFNSDSWNGNLFISSDKKFIFFSSEKAGGVGGKDIYYCIYDSISGNYGDPKNIGTPVNTKFDEIEPKYYPAEKVLFFSSRGHSGYGGYDVYYSKYNSDGTWGEPKNFGSPINSTRDDIGFVKSDNDYPIIAFLASNREGGKGKYDIYRIVFSSEMPIKEPELEQFAEEEETDSAEVPKVIKKDSLFEVVQEPVDYTKVKADTTVKTKNWPQGLILKVQIGAYRKKISVADVYLQINTKDVILEMNNGLYKYLMKDQFKSLKEAKKLQKKLKAIGYKDVWVVPYYNGKRITIARYKELTKKK